MKMVQRFVYPECRIQPPENDLCYTMLCHIKDYPNDWVAVNNFLLMASGEQNVAINGPYPFGNQSLVVFYEMFPELMPTSLETE